MFLKTNEEMARGYMLLKTNAMGKAGLAAYQASQIEQSSILAQMGMGAMIEKHVCVHLFCNGERCVCRPDRSGTCIRHCVRVDFVHLHQM
jgi:hypothetical protein